MGYSKVFDPDTVSISNQILAQCGEGIYAVTALAYEKKLYFTVVKELSGKIRVQFSLDFMATAPDEIYIQWRVNGVQIGTTANWVGAWTTITDNVEISGLKTGDTIELWAYGTTGVTAALRNWAIYGVITPVYASE